MHWGRIEILKMIVLTVLLMAVLFWIVPAHAGEMKTTYELQWKRPEWSDKRWQAISTIDAAGELEIAKYLEKRKGPVDLRYWIRTEKDGEVVYVVAPLTVGE